MKSSGIVRRVDDLGRIIIPKEIRRTLNIKEGDPLELFVDKTDTGEPILCVVKYVSDSGYDIFDHLVTKLENIKEDCNHYELEKETADKVADLLTLLKENKRKFNF